MKPNARLGMVYHRSCSLGYCIPGGCDTYLRGAARKVLEYFQNRVRASSPDEAAMKLDEVVLQKTGRQVKKVCHLKETVIDGWYEFLVKLE